MRRVRRIWYQCAEFLLVLLGVGWLFAPNTGLDVVFLLAWDVLAIAVIVTCWVRIRRYRSAGDAEPASLPGWRSSFAATLVVSVVGMTAGGLILVANAVAEEDDELAFVLQVSAVPAVLAAWILLHFRCGGSGPADPVHGADAQRGVVRVQHGHPGDRGRGDHREVSRRAGAKRLLEH